MAWTLIRTDYQSSFPEHFTYFSRPWSSQNCHPLERRPAFVASSLPMDLKNQTLSRLVHRTDLLVALEDSPLSLRREGMVNIKAVIPNISSMQKAPKAKEPSHVKSSETTDRDANGQREDQHDQNQHAPMTEVQAEQVLSAINELPGVKDNNLNVMIEMQGTVMVALVKDSYGKVIRRIPERSLWAFLKPKDDAKKTGHLLDKAM